MNYEEDIPIDQYHRYQKNVLLFYQDANVCFSMDFDNIDKKKQ